MNEMDDLRTALAVLRTELRLSQDASDELLGVLEKVQSDPKNSVLYPENGDFSVEIGADARPTKAWLVGKTVYEHTFIFLVAMSRAGNRAIIDTIHASGPKE